MTSNSKTTGSTKNRPSRNPPPNPPPHPARKAAPDAKGPRAARRTANRSAANAAPPAPPVAEPVEEGGEEEALVRARHISTARLGRAGAAAERKLRELRRKSTSVSLLRFAQAYLPGYFKLPPSRMHREIAAILESARVATDAGSEVDAPSLSPLPEGVSRADVGGVGGRGLRLAVAAPRGHAKSTLVTYAFILWSICEKTEEFIVIASDTADQATDLLAAVKGELESNDRLRTDYPEVCENPLVPPKPERWRRDDLITRNGVRVFAMGAEQKIRGRKNKAARPTLVILDDIENEDLVRSSEAREARWDWLKSAVLMAGTSTTNVIAVGTLLHPKSMLAKLIDKRISPGWIGLKYQAITSWAKRTDLWDQWEAVYCNRLEHQGASGPAAARAMFEANRPAMLEGAEVLWPELEGYYTLMEQRVSEGPAPFAAEKQNDPLDLLNAAFREHEIQFWDDPINGRFKTVEELLNSDPRKFYIVGACDPSLGKPGGDDSAIVTLAVHFHTKKMYVIGADILRRRPDATLDAILTLHRMRKFNVFGVEEVQFQQFLKTELERRARALNLHFRIKGVRQTANKEARIARLQPLLAAGHLMLSKRHPTLLNQMLEFPTGRRDDGPDALEMAVRLCDTRAYGGYVIVDAW